MKIIKKTYDITQSAALLEGENPNLFFLHKPEVGTGLWYVAYPTFQLLAEKTDAC